ncbi:MAG: hypothetical protein Q4P30_03755 [Eubacteriales bacterium]|nr:hypothetical protein [Eubacteriales bacterium]
MLKSGFQLTFIFFCSVASFIPFISAAIPPLILASFFFGLGGSIWAIFFIKNNDFTALARTISTPVELKTSEDSLAKVEFIDLNVEKDHDLLSVNGNLMKDQAGYEYLHTLTFKRFDKIIFKPTKRKVIILTIIFSICFAFTLIAADSIKNDIHKVLNVLFASSFLYSYILNPGSRFTRFLFMYLDRHLLVYHYYRKPEAILTSLKIRLIKLLKLTMPITAILIIGCFTLSCIFYDQLGTKIFLWIPLLLIQGFFFSLTSLFIYYIFQPYNLKMESKGPMASIINGVLYAVSFIFFRKEVNAYAILTLAIIMAVLTLSYPIIIKKKGPKAFKLNERQ